MPERAEGVFPPASPPPAESKHLCVAAADVMALKAALPWETPYQEVQTALFSTTPPHSTPSLIVIAEQPGRDGEGSDEVPILPTDRVSECETRPA